MLGRAPMRIVDRIEHQILIMPAEGGEAHADIQPGQVDAVDVVLAWELHVAVALAGDVVEVPGVVQILLLVRMYYLLILSAEATSVLRGRDVRCILDHRASALLVVHHLPKVVLEF